VRPLLIITLALAGLAIGWCQRAIVFRHAVPAGAPPQRSCPDCGHEPLPASGRLLPVLAMTGRCPRCRARIGPPPLAVELTTAIMFGVLGNEVHPVLVLAAACWLAACCVPLAWIDAAVRRLPDALTAPAYAGTIAALLAAAGVSGHWHSLIRAVLGGLALGGFYLALAIISPSGIGLGDVKLAASVGSLLAWFGWSILLAGAFAGFLLAAIYGIALLALRRATWGQQIPFGPFMIAGAFAVILISSCRFPFLMPLSHFRCPLSGPSGTQSGTSVLAFLGHSSLPGLAVMARSWWA
jgi:leader peptidase (prepilin peptidase) / N-methyltransferase